MLFCCCCGRPRSTSTKSSRTSGATINRTRMEERPVNNASSSTDADVEYAKALGDRSRAEFIRRLTIGPPKQFRLIDCKSTVEQERVVLFDWHEGLVGGYTAVSHTFGRDIYTVFDCECTTSCFAKVPRRSRKPCPGSDHEGETHWKIVGDILKMCQVLMAAGAEYVWHDGVCIAQHNHAEVEDTIQHMGWIYANAKATVIFPHYVGSPMAVIRHDGDLVSRWQTRVWTFQEAAVSRCRRYCVRVGGDVGHCQSLQELEDEIAGWYDDDSNIAVIEEDAYWEQLLQLRGVLQFLLQIHSGTPTVVREWLSCIQEWILTLHMTCFAFPSMEDALFLCSRRDSEHEGDRINSILALAGVTDFVAPKESNMETSTVEFFKRQGQQGMALAVFSSNQDWEAHAGKRHSWVPSLSKPLVPIRNGSIGKHLYAMQTTDFIGYEVLPNGTMQLGGEMACVCVQFTARHTRPAHYMQPTEDMEGLSMDLYFSGPHFISFAHSSSLELGRAFLPGFPLSHAHGEVFLAPVIRECDIVAGEGFSAHLVFPVEGLRRQNPNPALAHNQVYSSVPALLVTGDLQAEVFKVGYFEIFPSLRDMLLKKLTQATMLSKLVII